MNIIRHGELVLKEVESLPTEAKLESEVKKFICAHSETGHHHVLESVDKFKVYSWNGETYISLGSLGTLFHEKTGKDVHTPHKISPAIYKINIKKSYDYFQKKMARVRD